MASASRPSSWTCSQRQGLGRWWTSAASPARAGTLRFNRRALALALAAAGLEYRHAVELGGRRSAEPGEERFGCVRTAAFRSYAARMTQSEWQEALAAALSEPDSCFMCAETDWRRCHRRLIADLLTARGVEVVHLLRPGEQVGHELSPQAEIRVRRLYLCGELVA